MSKLFIVSHRLPFTAHFAEEALQLKPSTGGLASGLLPLLGPHTRWIGWDGLAEKLGREQRLAVDAAFAASQCLPIRLPRRAHSAFYNDISNGVFWPLYHNQTGHIPLDLPHWSDYQLINRLFADRIAALVEPGDTVWIHDYHLQLLPRMLRERNLGVRISFFLHIPFPPAEIFRMLPIREEILEGLLGADTIGFHSEAYLKHFTQSVEGIVSYPHVSGGILVDGRKVAVIAAPLGVDARRWETLANADAAGPLVEAMANMRRGQPDLKIFLSVDRLDYTKGLPRKFMAFGRLLQKNPELRGQVTLIQIAPPSRDDIKAYSRYKMRVEQMAGAVNGKYGFPGYQPIQYLASAYTPEELAPAYRHADVMVVTPLMDGMNLVAKEFVAARSDGQGVLVLSEFAGAAEHLRGAFMVNPYDLESTADAMKSALSLGKDEQRQRMQNLREDVMKFDAKQWLGHFFSARKEKEAPEPEHSFLNAAGIGAIVAQLHAPLTLFIDYDGTLFPIVRRPELAVPDSSLTMLLGRLCQTPGIEVHLISGRRFEELFGWFHRIPMHIHAEHGGVSYNPITMKRSMLRDPKEPIPAMDLVCDIFERYRQLNKGVLIERKLFSTVFHYRMAEVTAIGKVLSRLKSEISSLQGAEQFDILAGKKAIEVRLKGISKARVIERCLRETQSARCCVAIGDDTTDADMFAALQGHGLAIAVGADISHAQYKLRDSASVREFLRMLPERYRQF